MVLRDVKDVDRQSCRIANKRVTAGASTKQTISAPSAPQNETPGMQIIREKLKSTGIQEKTAKLIMCAWRKNTKKHYATHYRKWIDFCGRKQINYLQPSQYTLLEFLMELFKKGCGYSSINSARSAVSAITMDMTETLGQSPLISKFMRGVFNSRPQLPRYAATWDVNIVLQFLKNWAPARSLALKQLSLKTALWLLLLSSQRGQTVIKFKIDTIQWTK